VSGCAFHLKNLGKNYGRKIALSGVTLSLEKGEIMGLVGPNGAGKTTMIKLIMGLIHPTAGSLSIFGKEHVDLASADWSKVGYIADEPSLYDYMTARQIIDFNREFYPQWNEERCLELLQRFHLPEGESIKNYSRGMKTQLTLILALAQSPDLLVLDEPLDGLDPLRRLEFLNIILEEFTGQEGRSILISSHYLEELERIADRIAFLHEGRLIRVVPMEQLKVEEKTIRVVFQKDPPEKLLTMPGIKSVESEGKTGFLITVEDNFNSIYEACCSFPHFVLEIYHRNLEDMFRDYAGRGDQDGL
jgi:ABC-2 type transport system ATP-binding protein